MTQTLPEDIVRGVTSDHPGHHESLHAAHAADGGTLPTAVDASDSGHLTAAHPALKSWYDAAHPSDPLPDAAAGPLEHEQAHEKLHLWVNERQGLYVVPPDIDATGGDNVAAALNAWLATVPDGAIADLNGGTFRCEQYVRADNRTDLTIRNGTLTRTDAAGHGGIVYPQANPHLWLRSPTRCRIENVHFIGTNMTSDQPTAPHLGAYLIDYEFEAGIRLEAFTDCAITGGSADGVWGDGVQAQGGDGLVLDGFNVLRNGRQGISPLGLNFTIRNCDITSRRAGIDMEPDAGAQAFGQVLIENVTIWSWLLAFGSFGPGNFDDVEIRYCTVARSGVPVVNADSSSTGRRDRWHVHHNLIGIPGWSPSSPAPVMRFHRSVDNLVENNRIVHYAPSPTCSSVGLGETGSGTIVRNNHFQDSTAVVLDEDGTTSGWTETNNTTGAAPPATNWDPLVGAQS